MTRQQPSEMAQPLALVLFSHQFATFLDTGIALLHSLELLQDAPPPYGAAAQALHGPVERGETLSHAMAEMPELFSPFYRCMVRAGEVGGMLEETLRRTAELMTKEWKLTRSCPGKVAPVSLITASGPALPSDWSALTPYQRTMLLALFCETFGLLLVSGVPIMQAMRTMADLLPAPQQEGLLAAVAAIGHGERVAPAIEPLGILPRFALELMAVGEESGHLDGVLERAANIFRHDLECRLLAEA
jgi:type II secretory pathway component PulF